jgi:signal transduction histidine kinase
VPSSPTFDWREVQRWGIPAAALPQGSVIHFRTPSVWETYRAYIVGTIVVVLAQAALIAALLTNRRKRKKAEETIRAREASLRASYDRIRSMAGRLINAQEAARAGIARDLHDDVCQKLAYVSIGVNSLRTAKGDIQDPETQKVFEELEKDTRNTFDGIRRLSHDLHPATLRLLGLAPALRSHCAEIAKRHAVEVKFDSGEIGTVDTDVAVCFFRIAQESLRNGIDHGSATHLAVSLARAGDRLEMTVADDGRGFDVQAVRSNGAHGLGLVTMEERINIVGGHASIASEVGHGTTVRVEGPAEPAPPNG